MENQYFIELKGQSKGPFKLEELQKLELTNETLIWKTGLSEWVTANELDELKHFVKKTILSQNNPPPLPKNIEGSLISIAKKNDVKNLEKRISELSLAKKTNKFLKTLKANTKSILLIIFITLICYVIIAYIQGGFQAISFYNKYSELASRPKTVNYSYYNQQSNVSSQQDVSSNQQSKTDDTSLQSKRVSKTVVSPLSAFVEKMDRETDSENKANGLPPVPKVSKGFAESQKVPVIEQAVGKDLTEYKLYLANPDPTDPNLDSEMVSVSENKIYEAFGIVNLCYLTVICYFLSYSIITSKMWLK